MRSAGGTKSGVPGFVTFSTKATMARFGAVSFHEGSASCAALEKIVTCLERSFETRAMRFFVLRRHLAALDRARAAVNHHAEFHWIGFRLRGARGGEEQVAAPEYEEESEHKEESSLGGKEKPVESCRRAEHLLLI